MCEWYLKYYMCIWWMGMFFKSVYVYMRRSRSHKGSFLFDAATKGRFIHNVAFHTIEQHYSNWNDFYKLEQEQKPTIKIDVLDWFRGNPTVLGAIFTGWEGGEMGWGWWWGRWGPGWSSTYTTLVPSPSWVRPSYLTQQMLNLDWKTLI